jgi:hypothetical protein
MKPILLLSFLSLVIVAEKSSTIDYDTLNYCNFSLSKDELNSALSKKVKACNISSVEIVEQIFGRFDQSKSFHDELFEKDFILLSYKDGLELKLSDNPKRLFTFSISSDKYSLVLDNGKVIKVGMPIDKFKTIFPKSFSKRSVINDWYGQEGNTQIDIFFSHNSKDSEVIGDDALILVFGKNTGRLELLKSYVPG